MRINNRFHILYQILILLCSISACTSVELCPEARHPHKANTRAYFNWGDANKADIPREMHIVASRIINTWRTHGIADTSKNPNEEDNIHNQQSSAYTTEVDTYNTSFLLRGGEYNIFVINEQRMPASTRETGEGEGTPQEPDTEIPVQTAIEIENLDAYINDPTTNVNDLYMRIKSMGGEKPDIVNDNDLPDFNPNYEYQQNIKVPIFHAIRKGVNINTGQETILNFDMQPISLGINIIFLLQLKANDNGDCVKIEDIDSPIVELSGICGRFNIAEAYLDTTKLYRMAHRIEKPDNVEEGNPDNKNSEERKDFIKISENTYRCTARFNTLGVIPSSSKNHLNGSGIVQVAIKVWSDKLDSKGKPVLDKDGKPEKIGRYVYAGINIYDELMAERLIEVRDGKTYMRYSKEDVDVKLNTPLVIEKDKIVPDDNGMGWTPFDPTNPDGDIDIEI